jgi:hypothetical protein
MERATRNIVANTCVGLIGILTITARSSTAAIKICGHRGLFLESGGSFGPVGHTRARVLVSGRGWWYHCAITDTGLNMANYHET